jgi:cytochrome d ubiquinol oxidase subunit II
METLWFFIVSLMLAIYVVLDGFDLGAGILHLFIARNNSERRTILNTIGPFWDGNEVWLLAAGGALYLAFPKVYASGFSGFYLPLMIMLWLFMLRGLGIEFRHHGHHPIWKAIWDALFAVGSILLTIFFGAALGNVIRGVPIGPDGYFFAPLWTTFTMVPNAGILDWYTVLIALIALSTLTLHGASYIAMKTEGEIQSRAHRAATIALWPTILLSAVGLYMTVQIRPGIMDNFSFHWWLNAFPVLAFLSIVAFYYFNRKRRHHLAFFSSSLFIALSLGCTAIGLYPTLLYSTTNTAYDLTISNSAAHPYGLGVGLSWWIIGIILTSGYFWYIYRSFHGKVKLEEDGEGY